MAIKVTKKVNTLALLIIGFILGLIAMYLYFQPKIKQLENDNSNLIYYKFLPPTGIPTPTANTTLSFRQTFVKICSPHSTADYCTCLYDVLHQNYSDTEIENNLKSDYMNVLRGQTPMFNNAMAECTQRFNSQ